MQLEVKNNNFVNLTNLIKEELDVAKNLLDSLDNDFKGNLTYALSLRYNDLHLEKFIKNMQKMGYDKDTTFIFTADHGSSFMYYPIREQIVNNLYSETYNVPFIVYGNKVEKGFSNGFYTTKDMVATICNLASLNVSPNFTGENIIEGEKDYAITEYLSNKNERDLPKLMEYAKKFNVEADVSKYLEVLI